MCGHYPYIQRFKIKFNFNIELKTITSLRLRGQTSIEWILKEWVKRDVKLKTRLNTRIKGNNRFENEIKSYY